MTTKTPRSKSWLPEMPGTPPLQLTSDKLESRVPVRLKVPSRPDCLATVCTFVEGACKALAPLLPPEGVHDVTLAVNEACANIIRHAYRNDARRSIWVRAAREGDSLVFTTIDGGEPTGELFLASPEYERVGSEPRENGYGVMLIEQLMDEVHYSHDPRRGNVLVMKKKLPDFEEDT
jgi:serine/threonine-protein kinase RsbW